MSEFTPPIIQNTPEPSNGQAALQHQSSFRKWAGLGILTLGLAIVIIDTTLLNVSLLPIIKDLHTNIQSLQWVITSYALVLAAFTITGGRLGDLFGRKKMFMLGAVIFAIGSFLASISHSVPMLLIGESIIEGFGAALMMPATASLVVANFTGQDRAKAFGIWGGAAGASSAIGPLLGGYLTTHFSWRWGFRINLFIAALVIIGSILFLTESRDERKPTLDWGGVFLSALGLLGITFGIIESSTYGWWKAKEVFTAFHYTLSLGGLSVVPVSIAIGVMFLAAFFWWEKRVESKGRSPLVSMSLLKNKLFTTSATTISILTLAMSGLIFALPIFLQSVKGLDAFHTGLAMLPLSATLLVVAPLVGILGKKVDPRYLIQAGLFIDVIAAMILHFTLKTNVTVGQLIPGLTLYGVGMGMVFPPISNLTLSAVPVEMAGEASGVNNTLRQVGATLGAAIIGAAVLTSLTSSLSKGITASPVIPDAFKQQIVQNVANPNSNIEFGGASNTTNQLPPAIAQEIRGLANEASAKASRDAYLYAAMFSALGLAVALFIPKPKARGEEVETDESEDPHTGKKAIAAATVVIIAFGGGIGLLKKSSDTVISTGANPQTAADIRTLFTPPQIAQNNQSQNPSTAPSPTPSTTPQTVPPIRPAQTSTPQQSQAPRATHPRGTSQTQPPVVMQTYKNQTLGFQMNINSNWQAQAVSNNTVVFTSSTGQDLSVQAYNGYTDGLDTVWQQLKGSPSATGLSWTTFNGEKAISFRVKGTGQAGLSLVHNDRLYYIMGSSLNTAPLSTFTLL